MTQRGADKDLSTLAPDGGVTLREKGATGAGARIGN
jgi:hypothetical protein